MNKIVKCSIVFLCLAPVFCSLLFADCTIPFYDGLENESSVIQNGGSIEWSATFTPALTGNGANFGGDNKIVYTNPIFNSESGSVSLLFKKTTEDSVGGIFQLGAFPGANSMAVFYNYTSSLYFEIKNSAGAYYQVRSSVQIPANEFIHIIAMWDKRDTSYSMKLFVNGIYVGGKQFTGTIVHNQNSLVLGTNGWYGNGEGVMDEVRFFNWMLSDPEVYAEYVYASNKYRKQTTAKSQSTGPVQLSGKNLYVNGQPFQVKGVGYQPVPYSMINSKTTLDEIYTNPNILARDLPLLRTMGVNTVRLWAEIPDTTLLDALYNGGDRPIYAIMAFEVPTNINYADPATLSTYQDKMIAFIQKFKNHPAVLAWGIGNENNLHYTGNIADWYLFANQLAQAAYGAEGASYHPTMLINGYMKFFGDVDYFSDDTSLNYVDMWGHNTYVRQDFRCYFDYFDRLTAKPLVMTEFGLDAFDTRINDVYPDVQAQGDREFFRQIKSGCVGGTVMAYSDEWWKGGQVFYHNTSGYSTDVQPDGYSNEEWWGVMAIQQNPQGGPDLVFPRKAYCSLKAEFTDFAPPDFDRDNDVDQSDFGHFQVCYTGSGVRPAYDCYDSDFDCDGDVDLDDFGYFFGCMSGPMVSVSDTCWDIFRAITTAPHPTSLSFNPKFDNDRDGFDTSVDCDDARADIHPGAKEICNQVDDNCDGLVDEDSVCVVRDTDRDGVLDSADACPQTPRRSKVDRYGCSASQFCENITIRNKHDQQSCLKADWKENEGRAPRDCDVYRNPRTRSWVCQNLRTAN